MTQLVPHLLESLVQGLVLHHSHSSDHEVVLQQLGLQLEPSSVHMWLSRVQSLSQWTEVTSSLLQARLSVHVDGPGPTHQVTGKPWLP